MTIYFNSYSPRPARLLSNFAETPVGEWATAEHMYQAAKCYLHSEVAAIKHARTALMAKRLGSRAHVIPAWEATKVDVMRQILALKVQENANVRTYLLSTGDAELVHKAPWDAFWGDGRDGNGQNVLGKLLMELRAELRKELQS